MNLALILYYIPVILISLSFHELSHAYVSYKLGDPTAKMQGRLTLNPLKHLDPIGTLMLLMSMFSGVGIGWAKPVPINPNYYNDKKKGTMLVSLAGPLSNILLSIIFCIPMTYISMTGYGNSLDFIIYKLSVLFFYTNISLAVFNILPVPPLDGSKILSGILPTETYYKFMQYENYIGIIFLIVLFMAPKVLSAVLNPLNDFFIKGIKFMIESLIKALV